MFNKWAIMQDIVHKITAIMRNIVVRQKVNFAVPLTLSYAFYCFEQFLPCGYKGNSKKPAHTSCEYSCAGGITQ